MSRHPTKHTGGPARSLRFGFLIPGLEEDPNHADDVVRFRGFLAANGCLSTSDHFRLSTAKEIHVIAIGHGGFDNGLINGALTPAEVIAEAANCMGEHASRVSRFRLQVCHQGPKLVTVDENDRTVLRPEIKEALGCFRSAHPIEFSAPVAFSYIKEGSAIDTNARSMADMRAKKDDGTLETVGFTIKSGVPAYVGRAAAAERDGGGR